MNVRTGNALMARVGLFLICCVSFAQIANAGWQPLPAPGMASMGLSGKPGELALASEARLMAIATQDPNAVAIVDPDGGTVSGTLSLSSKAVALALNPSGTRLFVLQEDSASVSVYDTATRALTATWPVGGAPVALGLRPNSSELLVLDAAGKRVVALNSTTGAVARSQTLTVQPEVLYVNAAGTRVLIGTHDGKLLTLDGSTWSAISSVATGDSIRSVTFWESSSLAVVVQKKTDAVSVVNVEFGAIVGQVGIDTDPSRVALQEAPAKSYVTSRDDLSISQIDLVARRNDGRFLLPTEAAAIVFDSTARVLYATQPKDMALVRLDPAQALLLSTISLNKRLRDVAVNQVTHEATAAAEKSNELSRIRLSDQSFETIALPDKPYRIALDSTNNQASVAFAKEIRFVNLGSAPAALRTERVQLDEGINALAVDSVRGVTLVTTSGAQPLHVIDNGTRTKVASISSSEKLTWLAIDSQLGRAYVSTQSKKLLTFDIPTRTFTATHTLGYQPDAIAVDSELHLAVLIDGSSDKAHVFDLLTGQITRTVTIPRHPGVVDIQADTHIAVIGSKETDQVSLFNLVSGQVTANYAPVDAPFAIAISTRYNQALVLSGEKDSITIIPLPNAAPELTSIAPSQVVVGAAAFTLAVSGRHFVDRSKVMFGSTELVTRWVSATRLDADVPASLLTSAASVSVLVRTPAPGGGDSASLPFTVSALTPSLTSIAPTSVAADGQAKTFTLMGQNFSSSVTVLFGAVAVVPSSSTPSQITVQAPGSLFATAGTVAVKVRNADGQETGSVSVSINAVPAIASVSPATLVIDAQAHVFTLVGTGFQTGATVVVDGNQTLAAATTTSTQITVSVPSSLFVAPGSLTLAVRNPDSSLSNAVTVSKTAPAAPVLSTVVPASVPAGSPATDVVLNGSGFVIGATVKVGAVAATLTSVFISSQQLRVTVPADQLAQAGNLSLTVVNPGQIVESARTSNSISLVVAVVDPLPPFTPPPLSKTVATNLKSASEFLYTGPNPVQTGVAPGTIQAKRIAVVRGKVLSRDGQPLSGVTVRVVGRPEFGQTKSRLDGMFDMALNGGATLAISYEKAGYLRVQRHVEMPWQNYVQAPDVVLSAVDTNVTVVDLAQPNLQVARGSVSTDSSGSRQATVMFPPGTTAARVMPDGSTQPISVLSVRATEYTVGTNGKKAMPAALPPTSAYTYAVELSIDEFLASGAQKVAGKDVLFNQAVPFYVDNFLNFPIGGHVPVGYYDNDKSAWIPYPNGRVIKLLSIGGGMATVDSDGDGVADSASQLAALGISDAERSSLAALYPAGKSLWRVGLTHFSTYDLNWPFQPDPDVRPPTLPPGAPDNPDKPECIKSSIIECQNQVLGETVRVAGTPFSLNYVSSRTPGYKATIRLPLSGASISASLRRIDLEVEVAGRLFTQTFPAAPNQSFVFEWDGLDAYGRQVVGAQPAVIRVGYVYGARYTGVVPARSSWGEFGSASIALSPSREEVAYWQQSRVLLGIWDARAVGLGGWTFDVHHAIDQAGTRLGTGRNDSFRATASLVKTVAGNGSIGTVTGSVPATSAPITVNYTTVDANGNLFIADNSGSIFKVTPDGVLSLFVSIAGASGMAVDAQGNLFVAVAPGSSGSNLDRVAKVSPLGVISTVAGTVRGFDGDGGPATSAKLNFPFGVAVDSQGNLFIADNGNLRVRKVSTDGTITTIAGTGVNGFGGDGGPAINATFSALFGVDLDRQGNIFVADANNQRIRRIATDGTISTIAGNGVYPPLASPDGLPATGTGIGFPWFVKVDSQGNIYTGDRSAQRLYRVRSDGVLTTVTGNGVSAFGGDGGLARAADIAAAADVGIDPFGRVFLADAGNRRIRQISPKQVGFDDAEAVLVSADGTEMYQFDLSGRHIRTLNAKTGATRYALTYSSSGYLTRIADGDGNATTIERAGDTPTAIVAPDGQRTVLGVDANGYLNGITNPSAEKVTPTHAADGLLSRFMNARLYSTNMTYATNGRLILDANAGSGSWTLARTDAGDGYEVSATSALSRQTKYRVETLATEDRRRTNTFPDGSRSITLKALDGTTTITEPDGSVSSTAEGPDPRFGFESPFVKSGSLRMPSNLAMTMSGMRSTTLSNPADPLSLISQTDTVTVNGKTTTASYSAATRTFTVATPMGRQLSSVVDMQGRVTRAQKPGVSPIDYGYDTRGRPTTVTQSDGAETRSTSITYNAEGFVGTITDPLLRTYSYSYDLTGRAKTLTLPGNRVIEWRYDANGNVIGVIPPGRPLHGIGYNEVDLEDRYTPPVVAGVPTPATQYAYNADKQPTTITRPDGQAVSFTYDGAGRPDTMTLPSRSVTSTYFATTGKLATLTTSQGVGLSFTYDGALPLTETFTGSVAGNVTRVYDSDFRVTSLSVNGTPVILGYDNDGQLTQVGALTIARDPQNGRVTGTTFGSSTTTQGYNGFGEVNSFTASYSGAPLYVVGTSYDKLGNITQVVESVGGQTNTLVYSYDDLGRLFLVTRNGGTQESYAYDDNGNRTLASGVPSTYDDQDRLLTLGVISYTHTANGERKTKTVGSATTTYTHDALGNLTQVVLPNGTAIDYVLDGRSRRIGKKVNGTLVQGFLYEDQLRPVAELDGSGAVVSRFVYAEKVNVPEYIAKGTSGYRIITDARGSPRLVVNAQTGAVEQRIDYDVYGRITADSNPGFQPFGFAGGLYDRDVDLTRFGARNYDADAGRWISKDPLKFAGGDRNLYAYVGNNPVTFIDPTGLRPLTSCERTALRPYIPEADLDNADVRDGEVPLYLGSDFGAITRGNIIYFRPGVYDPSTTAGISLLGHELVHVGQYRGGMTAAGYLWSTRNGYRNSPYEREAYGVGERIQNDLGIYGGNGICSCRP